MSIHREIVKKRHRILADKIRAAEEQRDRGDPAGAVELKKLQAEIQNAPKELRQAIDKDNLKRTHQRRERRDKFEKMLDALRGDL